MQRKAANVSLLNEHTEEYTIPEATLSESAG